MARLGAVIVLLIVACGRSSPPEAAQDPGSSPRPIAKLVPADPPAGRGAASPNLVAIADGALLTWLEPVEGASHRLRFARFEHGSWSSPIAIAEGPQIVANWADVPSIARQQDGVLVAHWAENASAAHAYDVVLARSVDGGATWKRLGSPHRDGTATEHGFVSLIPGASTTLALWLDGRATGEPTGATMLRAATIGDAIDHEQVVDDRVCDCCSTAASLTADGPAIVFRDRGSDELRDISIARMTNGAWSASKPVHRDGWTIAGCPVNGPAIAAAGRDVSVAWYTLADRRAIVRVAFSSDAGATFDRAIDVDVARGARAPIGRVGVTRDGADALVAWIAAEGELGRLLVRRVTRAGRLGTELEIATLGAGRDTGFPRIVTVGDDVLVAWTDVRGSALRAARLPRSGLD